MPQFQMALVGREDEEGDSDWHRHDDKSPRDPSRVVDSEELGLGDEVDGYRGRNREDGNSGHSDGKPERLWPPVEAVQVEHFGDPYQGGQVVEAVVDEDKKPKVNPDPGSAVTRHLTARSGSRYSGWM